jgi:hypothetical protein
MVQLFGLNTDGDVNDDDKLYTALACAVGSGSTAANPCLVDELVTELMGSNYTCTVAEATILDYVRQSCFVYYGWIDNCDGCTSAPGKWGRASTVQCSVGAGADNGCATNSLGGNQVEVFGLNTDGDVNDDDKLYLGIRCVAPPAPGGPVMGACPQNQFMTGTHADGSIECASPAPQVQAYLAANWTFYYGHRDSCDGCTTAPAKWGWVKDGSCSNGLGANNTCTSAVLGAETVELFGLNTDGDVNDDDKFYVGMRCN